MAGNSTNMPPPQDRTKFLLSGFTKALNVHFSVFDSASTTSLLPVCHNSNCTSYQLQVKCNIPFPSLPDRLRLHTTPTANPPGTEQDCNVHGERLQTAHLPPSFSAAAIPGPMSSLATFVAHIGRFLFPRRLLPRTTSGPFSRPLWFVPMSCICLANQNI